MTTIAYRDRIMAADSGRWQSNVAYRSARKLAVGPDGSLHGICGGAADGEEYLRWVNAGMQGEPPKPESTNRLEGSSAFLALVVMPDGLIRLWTAYGWEDHFDVPYVAIGAGSEMAVGAMAAGASAERAIEIVADNSGYALTPVRTVQLSEKKNRALELLVAR